MAQLSSIPNNEIVHFYAWHARQLWRRLFRRHGLFFVFGLAALLTVFGLSCALFISEQRLHALRHELVAASNSALPMLDRGSDLSLSDRLRAFENYLLPNDDVPDTVESLFRRAESDGLELQRGEYKLEPDQRGGFLRYRMTLPIKGEAQTIYRFILSALLEHKSLALASLQFKRERADAKEVEANIEWILLARLPPGGKTDGLLVRAVTDEGP